MRFYTDKGFIDVYCQILYFIVIRHVFSLSGIILLIGFITGLYLTIFGFLSLKHVLELGFTACHVYCYHPPTLAVKYENK